MYCESAKYQNSPGALASLDPHADPSRLESPATACNMETPSDNEAGVLNLHSVLSLQVAPPPRAPPGCPLVLNGLVHRENLDHLVHPGVTQLRVIVVPKYITHL